MEAQMKMKILVISLTVVLTTVFVACLFNRSNESVVAQTTNDKKGNLPLTSQSKTPSPTPDRTVKKPDIISRKDWQAKDPIVEAKEHTVRFITIHHTATKQKEGVSIEKKMRNLQNFSQTESRLASGKLKPAWSDVPYHFYIAADGKIAEGRELIFVGDTNTDYNPTGHALIVLEGSFDTEEPTAAQQNALPALAAWLASQYNVPTADIKAHNDYASTACPGKNLKKLLPSIQDKVWEMVKVLDKPKRN
jgi:hypothetical protein